MNTLACLFPIQVFLFISLSFIPMISTNLQIFNYTEQEYMNCIRNFVHICAAK